ncbi:MAG: winged helix-turn-helix domain-containing protein [Candidatus Gottesmanbacteria bacterium]|nr:winged helix-turn-helix domain-containing protein [Candidatus Gottesmanbacteria bacterium]
MLIRKRLIDKTTRLSTLTNAIAHRYRLAILYLLAHDPKETRELAYALAIREPLLIHHVQIMVKSGWLRRIKTGRHVTYELKEDCAIELKKFLGDTPFFRNLSR